MNTVPSTSPAVVLPDLLVLDGAPDIAAFVPRLRETFHVTIAPSIESAVEYLRRSPLESEIVISDVAMKRSRDV